MDSKNWRRFWGVIAFNFALIDIDVGGFEYRQKMVVAKTAIGLVFRWRDIGMTHGDTVVVVPVETPDSYKRLSAGGGAVENEATACDAGTVIRQIPVQRPQTSDLV